MQGTQRRRIVHNTSPQNPSSEVLQRPCRCWLQLAAFLLTPYSLRVEPHPTYLTTLLQSGLTPMAGRSANVLIRATRRNSQALCPPLERVAELRCSGLPVGRRFTLTCTAAEGRVAEARLHIESGTAHLCHVAHLSHALLSSRGVVPEQRRESLCQGDAGGNRSFKRSSTRRTAAASTRVRLHRGVRIHADSRVYVVN